jgi:hypothetical protein
MALTNTTLSAACGAGDLTLAITSTSSGFPAVGAFSSPPQMMRVDGESMLIQVVPVANTVKVMQRGYDGTVAVPHEALAVVSTSSSPQDFLDTPFGTSVARPPYVDNVVTLGVNTTFTASGTPATATTQPYPTKNTTYYLNKAGVLAVALIAVGATTPAPSAASAGVKMTFIGLTANAHTVTYGPGFNGNTTTSDVATSNGLVGATLELQIGPTGLITATNASVNATTAQWTLG